MAPNRGGQRGRKEGQGAAERTAEGAAAPCTWARGKTSDYQARCEALRMYYSALGKAEWWWIMDDVEEMVAEQLNREGYVVLDNFLLPEQAAELEAEVERAHRDGKLEQAGLVNGKIAHKDDAAYWSQVTRGDVISWVDAEIHEEWPYGRGLDRYLTKLGTLVEELGGKERNLVPELGRITSRSKAMVACYPGGGSRYVRHVDNDGKHEMCRTRVLTALMYLNKSWAPGDGGELAIYKAEDENVERAIVEPRGNRVLLFWSDRRTPHEVRRSNAIRYSVTLWFLDNTCNGLLPGTVVQKRVHRLSEIQDPGPNGNVAAPSLPPGHCDGEAAIGVSRDGRGGESARGVADDARGCSPSACEDAGGCTSAAGGDLAGVGGDGAAEHACDGAEEWRPVAFESAAVRYEWLRPDGEADERVWELSVVLLGDAASSGCPLVDVSEAQVRLAAPAGDGGDGGAGRPLLCVPLPVVGSSPVAAPKWSRKRASLVLRFGPPSDIVKASPEQEIASQLATSSCAIADGFLPGPEADALRAHVLAVRGLGGLAAQAALRATRRRCDALAAKLIAGGSVAELAGLRLEPCAPTLAVHPAGAAGATSAERECGGPEPNLCVVVSLNPFWRPEDGGRLRLPKPAAAAVAQRMGAPDGVEPLHGRVVAFLCQGSPSYVVHAPAADMLTVTFWYAEGKRLPE